MGKDWSLPRTTQTAGSRVQLREEHSCHASRKAANLVLQRGDCHGSSEVQGEEDGSCYLLSSYLDEPGPLTYTHPALEININALISQMRKLKLSLAECLVQVRTTEIQTVLL